MWVMRDVQWVMWDVNDVWCEWCKWYVLRMIIVKDNHLEHILEKTSEVLTTDVLSGLLERPQIKSKIKA